MKTNAWLTAGVLSIVATALAASSAFAGMVDVRASGAISTQHTADRWAGGLFLPPSEQTDLTDGVIIRTTEAVWDDALTETAALGLDSSNGGHILDLARRSSSTLPSTAPGLSEIDSRGRPGVFPSNPGRAGEDDARALALPDALGMFPLGAAVAALAIRRMQRRPGSR